MSLQKICKYAEILESIRDIQHPSQSDQIRSSVIQNASIAGLIESGAPYKINEGQIYIENDNGYIVTAINSLYPYLSQTYKEFFSTNSAQNNQPSPETLKQSVDIQKSNNTATVNQHTTENQINTNTATNNASVNVSRQDILSLHKNDLTYERCNLELIDTNGQATRFSVHCAPLRDANDDIIIVRLKLLGNGASYILTQYGQSPTFEYNGFHITVSRDTSKSDIFSCNFICDSPNYVLNKINIEHGGNKGNPVIFDDNLELRIYPFPNLRDKESGKMVFGNNKQGEAAFLYFMFINGNALASSGSERKPSFVYDNANLSLTAKWKDDVIAFTAIENN